MKAIARRRLTWLAGVATVVSAMPAFAQDAPAPEQAGGSKESDEIVVTGSRIQRPDYEAPNPIVSLDDEAIAQSGNTNVTTFLQRVPALTNSVDGTRSAGNAQPDGAIGQAGLNLLDLRGLGSNRTLVLVDGRRHVAGQPDTAAVDINSIPTDLIERIDVLTGAASAVYGADGVSGVVNFILRRDFDGIAARGQVGISDEGDGGSRFASIIVGRNFAGGRANLTLAYEYAADDPLANDDRDYLRGENRFNFVNLNDYDPARAGSFQQGPVGDLRYPDSSIFGYTDIGGVRYRGDGAIYTPGERLVNDAFSTGGDDTPVAGYIGDIFPQTERHAFNLLARFDASDAFKVRLEGKFVQTEVETLSGYTGNYPATISLDNPFIPASIRAAFLAENVRRAAAGEELQSAIFLSRNNFDLPRRGERDRRRTWRGVAAVEGAISPNARYDISYTYGRTDLRATKLNDRVATRFTEALDAVRDPASGQIVCRLAAARAAGCVPVNTFGANTVDPVSFDYYLFDPVSDARIEQHVVNASLTGDFGQLFELPGGPIQFAVGAEYRRESSRFRPAQELVDGLFYLPDAGIYDEFIIPTPSDGSFDVWEAFGELNVPLLRDAPFADLLSVGAAGRYSDYSTVGGTRAYQFNGIWAPIEDISFRGSYGRSVRAPNVAEFFRPRTGSGEFITDPCYLGNRGGGTQFREANCVALITAAGGNPATFSATGDPFAITNRPGFQQGNADLSEETATTWTAGVVLRPRFAPGLQIGIDWYDIRIEDAISLASASTIADLCVDQPTTDNAFCASQTRQAGTGYISSFVVQPENVAAFRTAGLELNATYAITTAAAGRFDLRLVGGYLDKLEQIATPGADIENNVDRPFRPQYSVTFSPTWTLEPLTLSYNLRWQNGVRRFGRFATDDNPSYVDPRYFRFKELWQHDLQLRIAASEAFEFYAGVNNLGNQKPDIGFETNVPISPLGRFIYAGARVVL